MTGQQTALGLDADELHVLAEARAQDLADIAEAVDEAAHAGGLAGPEGAGEELAVDVVEAGAPAGLHVLDEETVEVELERLQAGDVLGLLGQEGVEDRLVVARGVEAPLDAVVVNTSGCGTTIKDYGFMFRTDPAYAAKAAKIASLARDVSPFVSRSAAL